MTSLLKVLMLVENNGYPRDFRVRREAQALRDAGHQVSVICPREGREPWQEVHEGVYVQRYPAPPGGRGFLGYAFEFGFATVAMLVLSLWLLARRGVDVVHAANPPDTLCLVGAVFRLLGKRFVFDQHDLAPELYLSRFARRGPNAVVAVLRLLERCSYAVANVVIATNDSYRRRAIEIGRVDADKVFVVRNGPPLSYGPLEPDPALVERARFIVGYVGTIGPQDGLDVWMRALRHLVFDLGRREVLAVVIGDGDALADVRSLAARLELEPFVHFTGRLSEDAARKVLSAAHVCVQPDPSSPLNDHSTMNKLMEYMALGKPTVAFDLPETRFSAQEAAHYVVPNDEEAFARAVAALLDAPRERERMGRLGMRRVIEALAWEHSVRHLLDAYAAVAAPARHGGGARRPTVSVVVPCYNYGRFLSDCVHSVLAQQGVDVDVLIIDDASPDGSASVAEALAARDDRVRVIRHAANHGHIATYNEGLAQATGDYVVLLSADDLLTPGALQRATAVMERHPGVGLVYGHPLAFESQDEVVPSLRMRGCTVWRGEAWIAAQCRRGLNCIFSPEAVVRRRVQHAVGGYSHGLPHTADLEMWLRIAAVSDVARIHGADQALRRNHDASMMHTRYWSLQDDLAERFAAYERFFAGPGRALTVAPRARAAAQRSLAEDALRAACDAVRSGNAADADEFVALARRFCATAARLPGWRALKLLRAPHRTPWHTLLLRLHAAARDVRQRLRWRRWRHLGV